jgi:hypothetical protein
MRVDREIARFLAWAALVAQLVFIASWVVAGALEDGYSHLEQGVSELGADNAENPLIANAGIVVLGLSFIGVGLALLAALPRRPARQVAVGLFVAAGVSLALAGVFPLECGMAVDQRCEDLWRAGALSWQHDAHLWSGFAAEVFFVLTPFAISRALWPSPVGAAALSAGVFGVLFFLVAGFGLGSSESVAGGLLQRTGFAVMQLWVLIVVAGVLWETRGQPARGDLAPIRPRDFLSSAWTGEGELVIWPYFIGRRLARRFTARRQATWLSDRVWRFDDEADYGNGRVQKRRTYCEFVSEDHVRLTATDLPDGADVQLEEDGYRITPWRMTWPIGPFPLLIRCRDTSRIAPDGTFVNVIEARTPVFGLPLAQTRFYVRPTERASVDRPRTSAASAAESRG